MRQMRDFLQQIIRQVGLEGPLKDQRVIEMWPEVVGETIAAVSTADRVENGVLYVRVPAAVWRTELSLEREKILRALWERTGCRHICEIRFI
jgi:predicted nucleic acid-binding Zn ribbon protein